jgi:hypothetical protein
MSQHIVTTAPVGIRRRTTTIAIGLTAVLALGVGVAVGTLTSGGSESVVHRSASATPPAPAVVHLCGNDVTNLLATIGAMPPSVQAQVVGSLSPDLANGLGNLALSVEPSRFPPAPDNATLGGILTRLDRSDRNAIMNGLPVDQQPEVAASEQSASVASFISGRYTACS